jgi:hypothetical protein
MSARKVTTGLSSIGLLLVAVLVFLGRGRTMTVDMMNEGEAPRALASLERKIGHPLRAVSMKIDHGSLTAELQSAVSPDLTDKWSVSRLYALRGLIDWEYVSGPQPVGAGVLNGPVRDRLFDPHDADLTAVPAIADAAMARVALREVMTVSEMSLSRLVYSGLRSGVGNVRWVISVRSAHESATAFADVKGHLTGTNLTGTLRAQLFDLYQGGQPLLDTIQALNERTGGKERLRKALIYRQSMRVEAMDPVEKGQSHWYSANIDGAYRESDELQPPVALMGRTDATFALSDVDWAALPRLLQLARDKVEMTNGEVKIVEVWRDSHAFGVPPVQWEIDLRGAGADSGRVTLDTAGNPRRIDWPKRRAREKQVNFLKPERMSEFLATLRTSLDPGSQILELVFRPDEGIVVVREPKRPRVLTDLHFAGLTLERSPMPEPPPGTFNGVAFEEGWLFELRSLDAGLLDTIRAAETAALDRLSIPGGEVTAVGVGRHQDLMPRVHDLNIEVRVTGEDRKSGRTFTDLKGRVLRVEPP